MSNTQEREMLKALLDVFADRPTETRKKIEQLFAAGRDDRKTLTDALQVAKRNLDLAHQESRDQEQQLQQAKLLAEQQEQQITNLKHQLHESEARYLHQLVPATRYDVPMLKDFVYHLLAELHVKWWEQLHPETDNPGYKAAFQYFLRKRPFMLLAANYVQFANKETLSQAAHFMLSKYRPAALAQTKAELDAFQFLLPVLNEALHCASLDQRDHNMPARTLEMRDAMDADEAGRLAEFLRQEGSNTDTIKLVDMDDPNYYHNSTDYPEWTATEK